MPAMPLQWGDGTLCLTLIEKQIALAGSHARYIWTKPSSWLLKDTPPYLAYKYGYRAQITQSLACKPTEAGYVSSTATLTLSYEYLYLQCITVQFSCEIKPGGIGERLNEAFSEVCVQIESRMHG